MKIITIISLFLLSVECFATVAGTWEGTGFRALSSENSTRTAKCKIKMSFSETADTLNLVRAEFICDTFLFVGIYEKISFELKNKVLFNEGEVRGSVQENVITFFDKYYSDDKKDFYTSHFAFHVSGKELSFTITESSIGSYNSLDYITGSLSRTSL